MDSAKLRLLLVRCGSYPVIEVAAACGELHELLPVKLFEHIGIVYHRLERVADTHFPGIAELRFAVLLHEESPDSLPRLLATAGFSDFAPSVLGVVAGFGELWKVTADHEIADYVVAHRAHLASLLLFELAHEGRAISEMERVAELGGLDISFKRWATRLPRVTPPNHQLERTGEQPDRLGQR
jgi:hypothetical protein